MFTALTLCASAQITVSVSGKVLTIRNGTAKTITALSLIGDNGASHMQQGSIPTGETRIVSLHLNPMPTRFTVDAAVLDDGTIQGENRWHIDRYLQMEKDAAAGRPIHCANADYSQSGDSCFYAQRFAERYRKPGAAPQIVRHDTWPQNPYTINFTFKIEGAGYYHQVTVGSAVYSYREQTGDSAWGIAADLCQLVNNPGDPNVTCSPAGSSINLTARTSVGGAGVWVAATDGNTGETIYAYGSTPSYIPHIVGWATIQDWEGYVTSEGSYCSIQSAPAPGGPYGCYGTGACSPQPNLYMPGKATVFAGTEGASQCVGTISSDAYLYNNPPTGSHYTVYDVAYSSVSSAGMTPNGMAYIIDSCIAPQQSFQTGFQVCE